MSSGSHYTVLARRFRPQAFDEVVGQEHVSRSLRNAIRSERVAHAYLFTGARGVGKTSMARILAKALNCPNVNDGVPCNDCEICNGISVGSDVDVMEIDGASNRGIDSIRSLRANVGVRSMRTQYKVYIIDEVHMLTKEAFNALLKTLEEPPPNVKFVFCTTEPEKVPDTILSRCQRFDFSTIDDGSISQRLREIAQAEGFNVENEAIELVARRARGSMRDSQSLFDQLLAFSEGNVTGADVHRMLGTASDDLLMRLFGDIVEHRPGDVINAIEEALSAGVRAGELLDQCVGYLRDLMVLLSNGATVRLASVGDSNREIVLGQARQMGLPNVLAAFQVLSEAKSQIFRSTFDRVLLEMALVQVALLENLTAISSLLSGSLPTLPSDDVAVAITDQKKTADLTPASAQGADDRPIPRHLLDFRPGCEEALLAQLLTQSSLALTSAIRKLDRIAIFEPNQLELVLSAAYDFARHVLDVPEQQSAIQRIVEDATGIRPVVRLQILAAEEEVAVGSEPDGAVASVATAARQTDRVQENRNGRAMNSGQPTSDRPSPPVVRDDVDPEMDPLVQEVVQVFGAQVQRVINAPTTTNGGPPQHEPADDST